MSLQPVHFFVQLSELVLRGSLCTHSSDGRRYRIRGAQRKGRAAEFWLRIMWSHLGSVEKISQLEQRQLDLVDRVSLRKQTVGRGSDRRTDRPSVVQSGANAPVPNLASCSNYPDWAGRASWPTRPTSSRFAAWSALSAGDSYAVRAPRRQASIQPKCARPKARARIVATPRHALPAAHPRVHWRRQPNTRTSQRPGRSAAVE